MDDCKLSETAALSARGTHAALLSLNKALPEIWRNPQKLTVLLTKAERRLDGPGLIVIKWLTGW